MYYRRRSSPSSKRQPGKGNHSPPSGSSPAPKRRHPQPSQEQAWQQHQEQRGQVQDEPFESNPYKLSGMDRPKRPSNLPAFNNLRGIPLSSSHLDLNSADHNSTLPKNTRKPVPVNYGPDPPSPGAGRKLSSESYEVRREPLTRPSQPKFTSKTTVPQARAADHGATKSSSVPCNASSPKATSSHKATYAEAASMPKATAPTKAVPAGKTVLTPKVATDTQAPAFGSSSGSRPFQGGKIDSLIISRSDGPTQRKTGNDYGNLFIPGVKKRLPGTFKSKDATPDPVKKTLNALSATSRGRSMPAVSSGSPNVPVKRKKVDGPSLIEDSTSVTATSSPNALPAQLLDCTNPVAPFKDPSVGQLQHGAKSRPHAQSISSVPTETPLPSIHTVSSSRRQTISPGTHSLYDGGADDGRGLFSWPASDEENGSVRMDLDSSSVDSGPGESSVAAMESNVDVSGSQAQGNVSEPVVASVIAEEHDTDDSESLIHILEITADGERSYRSMPPHGNSNKTAATMTYALIPTGYVIKTYDCGQDHNIICPVRDCQQLFHWFKALDVHFMHKHTPKLFNDNCDGTISEWKNGKYSKRSDWRSSIVAQERGLHCNAPKTAKLSVNANRERQVLARWGKGEAEGYIDKTVELPSEIKTALKQLESNTQAIRAHAKALTEEQKSCISNNFKQHVANVVKSLWDHESPKKKASKKSKQSEAAVNEDRGGDEDNEESEISEENECDEKGELT